MTSVVAIGVGVAAAAFLVSLPPCNVSGTERLIQLYDRDVLVS